MKKKLFWSMLTIAMVIIVSVVSASCKSDDEGGNVNSIVGEWVENNSHLIFKKDGSFYRNQGPNDRTPQSGTYSYNPTQATLVVNVVATDWNIAYQRTYIVQTLTATTLVLTYTDGDVMGFFTRKN